MIAKPKYGEPCNGCGLCCLTVQCDISLALFDAQERCPAIEPAGRSFACGLVRSTADYVPDITAWGGATLTETFALMLGAGIGCDGLADDEEPSPQARAAMHEKAEAAIATASPDAAALITYFRKPDGGEAA